MSRFLSYSLFILLFWLSLLSDRNNNNKKFCAAYDFLIWEFTKKKLVCNANRKRKAPQRDQRQILVENEGMTLLHWKGIEKRNVDKRIEDTTEGRKWKRKERIIHKRAERKNTEKNRTDRGHVYGAYNSINVAPIRHQRNRGTLNHCIFGRENQNELRLLLRWLCLLNLRPWEESGAPTLRITKVYWSKWLNYWYHCFATKEDLFKWLQQVRQVRFSYVFSSFHWLFGFLFLHVFVLCSAFSSTSSIALILGLLFGCAF